MLRLVIVILNLYMLRWWGAAFRHFSAAAKAAATKFFRILKQDFDLGSVISALHYASKPYQRKRVPFEYRRNTWDCFTYFLPHYIMHWYYNTWRNIRSGRLIQYAKIYIRSSMAFSLRSRTFCLSLVSMRAILCSKCYFDKYFWLYSHFIFSEVFIMDGRQHTWGRYDTRRYFWYSLIYSEAYITLEVCCYQGLSLSIYDILLLSALPYGRIISGLLKIGDEFENYRACKGQHGALSLYISWCWIRFSGRRHFILDAFYIGAYKRFTYCHRDYAHAAYADNKYREEKIDDIAMVTSTVTMSIGSRNVLGALKAASAIFAARTLLGDMMNDDIFPGLVILNTGLKLSRIYAQYCRASPQHTHSSGRPMTSYYVPARVAAISDAVDKPFPRISQCA